MRNSDYPNLEILGILQKNQDLAIKEIQQTLFIIEEISSMNMSQ